jgi:hypothetical protein
MAGDGADIEERIPKVPDSDVRNGTRQPVTISSKNGAMSVSIARIDIHAKTDARVQIAAPFSKGSTETMTGIPKDYRSGLRRMAPGSFFARYRK